MRDIKITTNAPVQINDRVVGAVQNNTIGAPPPTLRAAGRAFRWVKLAVWLVVIGGGTGAGLYLKYRHQPSERGTSVSEDKRPDVTFNGPTQLNNNSPGSTQNNYIGVKKPDRHLDDASKAYIRATILKDASVKVRSAMDDEANRFAEEVFFFMARDGYTGVGRVTSQVGGRPIVKPLEQVHYTDTDTWEILIGTQ